MTGVEVLSRVRSLVTADPFALVESPEPFSFDRVPMHLLADAVRLDLRQVGVNAGFGYSEERLDDLEVWVAKVVDQAAPHETRDALLTLANSLTSAIVRDGCGAGDFAVPDDGRRVDVEQPEGSAALLLRVTVPVSYMLTV